MLQHSFAFLGAALKLRGLGQHKHGPLAALYRSTARILQKQTWLDPIAEVEKEGVDLVGQLLLGVGCAGHKDTEDMLCCAQPASAQRRPRQWPRSRPMCRCPRPPTRCSWSGRSPGAAARPSPGTSWTWRARTLCSLCRVPPRLHRCPPPPSYCVPPGQIDSEAVSHFWLALSALMETQGYCQSESCSLACSWHGSYQRLFQDSLMDGREGSEALRRAHGSSVHCRRARVMHW